MDQQQSINFIEQIILLQEGLPPLKLEAVEEISIIVNGPNNQITNLISSIQSEKKEPVFQGLSQEIPKFYSLPKNTAITHFGSYLFNCEPSDKKTQDWQYFGTLNLMHLYSLAKKIRILIAIDEEEFKSNKSLKQGKLLKILTKLAEIFLTQLEIKDKISEKEQTGILDQLSQSIGLIITSTQSTESSDYKLPQQIYNKLSQIKKQLNSQLSQNILKNIINKQYIIFDKIDTSQQTLAKIEKIPSFKNQRPLNKQYMAICLSKRHEKFRQYRNFRASIKEYCDKLENFVNELLNRLERIVSMDENMRKQAFSKIQKFLFISFPEIRINPPQKNRQKIKSCSSMLSVLCEILTKFIDFYKNYDPDQDNPSSICLPAVIIENIFSVRIKTKIKSEQNQKIIKLGNFCQYLFKAFPQLIDFREVNIHLSPLFSQFVVRMANHLSESCIDFSERLANIPYPQKDIKKIFEKLVKLVRNFQIFLQNCERKIENDLPEYKNSIMYIRISIFKMKHHYINRAERYLTTEEMLQLITGIHEEYHEVGVGIRSLYDEESVTLLKKVYTVLGDQLMKFELNYLAIDLYLAANNLQRLNLCCQKYLSIEMENITYGDFIKIIKILVELGKCQIAIDFCYTFLQKTVEDEKLQLLQLILDIGNNIDRIDKLNYMNLIEKQIGGHIQVLSHKKFNEIKRKLQDKSQQVGDCVPFLP